MVMVFNVSEAAQWAIDGYFEKITPDQVCRHCQHYDRCKDDPEECNHYYEYLNYIDGALHQMFAELEDEFKLWD